MSTSQGLQPGCVVLCKSLHAVSRGSGQSLPPGSSPGQQLWQVARAVTPARLPSEREEPTALQGQD